MSFGERAAVVSGKHTNEVESRMGGAKLMWDVFVVPDWVVWKGEGYNMP